MIIMNVIDKFLISNFEAESTIKNYRSSLNMYFKILKVNPDDYFKGNRDYKADVKTFWMSISKNAPKTRLNRLSAIKNFLEEYDIDLPSKFWKKLKKRMQGSSRAITIDRIPTPYELRQILQHGDSMTRAITLIASSSGMRIGEILSILPTDVDFDSNPTKITIRGILTKSGDPRITFISNEATEALKEWLKVKDEWQRVAIAKSRNICEKNPDDKRLFPINHSSYTKKWTRLLTKSKLAKRDPNSGILTLHTHVLRKYFETRMSLASVPEAVYQQLEGHEGYLDGSYKRYTEEELKQAYLKGLPSILVFESKPDLTETHKEIDDLKKENAEMQKMMEEMKSQILELRLEKLEKMNGIKKK